jgi:hypothetical protein
MSYNIKRDESDLPKKSLQVKSSLIIQPKERSLGMAMTYKQKLIGEINALPEELIPRFYRIVRRDIVNSCVWAVRRRSVFHWYPRFR